MSDPENIKWSWLGTGKRRGSCTYYDRAQVVRISDKARRVFEIGNAVYVANDEGQAWVAQLVEMFQVGDQLEDDECQIVEDATQALLRMRCTLRWFYNADDETIRNSKLVSPRIPTAIRNEIYFSDHVENGNSNCLEVIEGRAFLCATEHELRDFHNHRPEEYWEGDAIRLVRCFYGYNAGNPPPIRELGKGELEVLIKNPSSDPDLYNRKRLTFYGPHGAVMKGTGARKRFQYQASTSPFSSRKTTDASRGVSRDSYYEGPPSRPETAAPSSRIVRYSDLPNPYKEGYQSQEFRGTRNRIVFSSSDDEFVPDEPKPREESYHQAEKIGSKKKRKRRRKQKNHDLLNARNARTVQSFVPKHLADRTPNLTKTASPKQSFDGQRPKPRSEQQKAKKVNSVHPDDMEAAWARVQECLRSGTRDQREHCFEKLPEMLGLFLRIMEDHNLKFDMDQSQKKAIARVVAAKFFNSNAFPTPGGASSMRSSSHRQS